MIRLSKKVEYALLAVQHMACRPGCVVSSKDIATTFNISLALVAKVLQALVHAGVVRSYHGVNGGYELAMPAQQISVADVMAAIEGSAAGIVDCQHSDHEICDVLQTCTIRKPLSILQERITATFASMSVAELANPSLVNISLS